MKRIEVAKEKLIKLNHEVWGLLQNEQRELNLPMNDLINKKLSIPLNRDETQLNTIENMLHNIESYLYKLPQEQKKQIDFKSEPIQTLLEIIYTHFRIGEDGIVPNPNNNQSLQQLKSTFANRNKIND